MSHTRYSSGSAARNAERAAKRCGWCGGDLEGAPGPACSEPCRWALDQAAKMTPRELLEWLEVI
jgi:hypothetical protein